MFVSVSVSVALHQVKPTDRIEFESNAAKSALVLDTSETLLAGIPHLGDLIGFAHIPILHHAHAMFAQ